MVVFEVKLICPVTKEVIYTSINTKPILPPDNLYKRLPKPLLVITTKDSEADIQKIA
jgi:hypothetical protein